MSHFVKLNTEVIRRTDITPSSKIVLAVISDRIGRNGHAWPGIRRIAADCGMSCSTVSKSIVHLEKSGLLVVDRVAGNPCGNTNRYSLPRRTESQHVPEIGTLRNRELVRTENASCDVPKIGTEPDSLNQTNRTIPKAGASVTPDELPESLNTDEFKAAWSEWVQHRREIKKPLGPTASRQQLRKCAAWGSLRSVEVIHHSISSGWQGLFEPKDSTKRRVEFTPAAELLANQLKHPYRAG